MSPRHNRRNRDAEQPRGLTDRGADRVEQWGDGEWQVRPISGQAATKTYRCPGCDQEIRPGAAHVVAWPADVGSVTDRRHWHTACWRARDRRGAKIQRGRGAPRY